MGLPKRTSPTHHPNATHDLKHRVITCLNKLSDRDTHTIAAAELEQIVRSLSHDSFSSFLACLYDTDSSHKTPVRKQCVRLLGLLSSTHGQALSPHLSKMISSVIKRLHDSDSVVRSACVDSVTAMSTHINNPASFLLFLRPLMDTMLLEQDLNSQMGSALCLSSVIDASQDPEPAQLQRVLPKLIKLLKCESFKPKPALLAVIRSVIGAGGSMNMSVVGNLVACLVDFLSSEDWAARKGAVQVLFKLAVVHRDSLSELKASCLTAFETRRFDKVKVVRDTMSQMIEAWKDVPGVFNGGSSPLQSKSSSTDNINGGCSPSSSVSSNTVGCDFPQTKKKILRRSSFPPNNSYATNVKKKSPLNRTTKTSTPLSHKLGRNRSSEWNVEVSLTQTPSVSSEDNHEEGNEKSQEPETNTNVQHSEINDNSQHIPETHCKLFSKSNDEKMPKFRGSRVVPYNDESPESTITDDSEEHCGNFKENENLSLIQKQLLQIESQQSSLLGLLQKLIGSSQNGIRSLETRVNGLEMALDEIMYDLTVTTGRMSPNESSENTCCKLPGTDFLSPKFWRKSEERYSTSRFSSGCSPVACNMADSAGYEETSMFENSRFSQQAGGGGFAVNPLASEIQNDRRNSRVYYNGIPTSIFQNPERRQIHISDGI